MKATPAVILSAYTGILMCDSGDMHVYIEHVMGESIFTHQLANEALWETIRLKIKENGDLDRACKALNTLPCV